MAQAIVIRSKVDEGLSLAADDGSPLHLAVGDILLVAKSGVSRHLRVDRKTGDLVRGTERRF